MYGTREDLCRMLNEQYPAETPLNLIIWTPADIEALADGMEYSFSEHDVRAVLERMDTIPEEQRLESGVSAGLVMALIDQVKENGGIQRTAIPFAKVVVECGGQRKLRPAEPVDRLPVIPDGKERGLAILPA